MNRDFPLEYYTESEREIPSPTYVPGVDYDPSDPDDVEITMIATQWDRERTMLRLEQENQWLKAQLAALEGQEDD